MDIERAFEVENGVITNPDQNTSGPFYTGGPSSPVGLDLPERTFYLQNISGGVIVWRKFGSGVNDWRQLSAQDIPFDPTNAQNETATNVQTLGENQANRHFGKDFATTTGTTTQIVTGTTFTTYSSLVFNVSAETGTNLYRLATTFHWSHSSASNSARFRIQLDGATLGQEIIIEPKDQNNTERIDGSFIWYPPNLSSGNHTFTLQFRPDTAIQNTSIYQSVMEAWRVS